MRQTGTIICTLFDGDYHYGLGALVNSLYAHGYRGAIWAGHRGELPPWARPARTEDGNAVFEPETGCKICFVPLENTRLEKAVL
jgi:hypothetical protein